MNNNKPITKTQKKIVEEAASRLAEIFIMQLEWEKANRENKNQQK